MRSDDFFKTTSPRLILEDYLEVNREIAPRGVLLQLAPFALHKKIGRTAVEQLFTLNPATTVRHRPWFIWNTLRLAGLDRHWYADELNRDKIQWRGWVRRIERDSTEEEKEVWKRLLYVRSFPDPAGGRRTIKLWSKGGGWSPKLGISKILVLHEHLDRTDCWYKRTLGSDRIKMIERELWTVCDPDRDIMPTQFHRAVEYVRSRTRDFTGRNMRYRWVAWFLDTDIPDGDTWWLKNGQQLKRHHSRIEW